MRHNTRINWVCSLTSHRPKLLVSSHKYIFASISMRWSCKYREYLHSYVARALPILQIQRRRVWTLSKRRMPMSPWKYQRDGARGNWKAIKVKFPDPHWMTYLIITFATQWRCGQKRSLGLKVRSFGWVLEMFGGARHFLNVACIRYFLRINDWEIVRFQRRKKGAFTVAPVFTQYGDYEILGSPLSHTYC